MKKIVSIILFAGCIFGVVACQKEALDQNSEVPTGKTVRMILNATQDDATKTVLNGTTAKWKEDDKVTVMYEKNSGSGWYTQESGAASSSDSYATASFTVDLTDPNTGKNAYAIYPANNLTQSVSDKAKITIAATQHPTMTSFDGASDILISKPFTPSGSVTTQFSRPGAVLKIKINNATLSSEKLLSLSVTGANALAGNVLVNLDNAAVSGIENGSNTVTAEYDSENQFTVGSGYYVYLIVKPQTLAEGSTLTVEGETENTTFSKDIIIPDGGIHLNAGHVVPLNITITSVSHKDKVFFKETFGGDDHALGTGNAGFVSDKTGWTTSYPYAAGSGGHSARFGQASNRGEGTTPSISIDKAFRGQTLKLYFKAAAWDGDGEQTSLSVSVLGTDVTLSGDALTDGKVSTTKNTWGAYTLNIGTSVNTSSITVSFQGVQDNKARFFLDDVTVYYGERPLLDAGLSYGTSFFAKVMADGSFTNTTISNPNDFVLSYSSSNTDVATVNTTTGEVTLKAKGSARITASSEANEDYAAGSAYYDLIVTDPPVTAFSWTRSSTDTYSTGFTFIKLYMKSNDLFYNENTDLGKVAYVGAYHSSTPMFSSTPAMIRLTAQVGAGSNNTSFDNYVYACLLDESGNEIEGTTVSVTNRIANKDGDTYVIYMPLVSTASGIKIYHAKEDSKAVRYYSMTLEYATF